MPSAQSIVSAAVLFMLLSIVSMAHGQSASHEDLTPCMGSAPEPSQSAAWAVAFCNRTGHDIVVEFHENDCPIQNWGRRGDVYRKNLQHGESTMVFLCYADESARPAELRPGTPTLRIPGGKGVVTTWSVVGDCGDRSDRLSLNARTFYDRGDYKTGIVLLQYPQDAPHCIGNASDPPATIRAQPPVDASPPVPPPTPTASDAKSALRDPRGSGGAQPILNAIKDADDRFGRTVRVFATTPQAQTDYKCRLTLNLEFTDGASFVDKVRVAVPAGRTDSLIVTRKYGKTVAKVVLASPLCTAQ